MCQFHKTHRGPDWSGIYTADKAVLAHERLSIVDVNTGAQPIMSESKRQALAVNGEIYNHQVIRERFEGRYQFRTQSEPNTSVQTPRTTSSREVEWAKLSQLRWPHRMHTQLDELPRHRKCLLP